MAFFTDTKVQEVIQANIERVEGLEEKQQEKLLRVFKRVRQQLLDRLLTARPESFTEQQVQVTLVQVEAAIEAIRRDLAGEMVEASEIMSTQGVSDLIEEVEKFSKKFEGSVQPINISAALIATEAQTFLVNKHQASIDAYTTSLRSQITSNIAQSMIARDTTQRTIEQLVVDVGRFFQGEEWRLRRIVRTELHNIYNYSKLKAMGRAGDVVDGLKKTLMHPMDSRTGDDSKALKARNPIVDMDQPFRFKWKGRERVFMFPPDRPNDRSILVPYKKAWDSAS